MSIRDSDHLDSYLDSVLVGGREPAGITIAAYDHAWPRRFDGEHQRIATAIETLARRIAHIGSTAVPMARCETDRRHPGDGR